MVDARRRDVGRSCGRLKGLRWHVDDTGEGTWRTKI
jgi:hypothetical protein